MLALLPGLYLGWGIGANDTAKPSARRSARTS